MLLPVKRKIRLIAAEIRAHVFIKFFHTVLGYGLINNFFSNLPFPWRKWAHKRLLEGISSILNFLLREDRDSGYEIIFSSK